MNSHNNSHPGIPFASPPRPTPKFLQEPSFSHKKHLGGTPRDSLPPRPPAKSLPSVSRLFRHNKSVAEEYTPRTISFRHSENSILQSPHYDVKSNKLYFDQCFTIESQLGEGSFGEVFKVISKEDGKQYAVKRSRDRFKGESDKRRRLEEVNKHESLSKHPNCVEFHKAWAERGHLYIQTELCKMSLHHYADENHNIPERVLWSFLVDLIQGLRHMHNHDLLHLDIKPENIFISYDGVCKLGDFGLSVKIRQGEVLDAQEGDPKYLAPELLQGKFGKHADVFSLGITILELASDLELPRNGESWHELRNGKIPWQLTAGISSELKGVIERMMHPDFTQRPSLANLVEETIIQKTIAWQRRRRALHHVWKTFIGWVMVVATFFISILFRLLPPLKCFHGNQSTDSIDASIGKYRRPSAWDLSYSDDDCFDNDISHSSLGCPLSSSSFSSEEDQISAWHGNAPSYRSFQVPTTPKLMKTRQHFSPRSSSPISSMPPSVRMSPYGSPNVSFVRGLHPRHTPTKTPRGTPRGTPLGTPQGTPCKLNFSCMLEEDSEGPRSPMIEPRSLSMEFEQAEDDSDID